MILNEEILEIYKISCISSILKLHARWSQDFYHKEEVQAEAHSNSIVERWIYTSPIGLLRKLIK